MRHRSSAASLLALIAATTITAPAFTGDRTHPERQAALCTAAVQHPIAVRVEALDPIARGGMVRLRVHAVSAINLSRAEVQITHAGGATVQGQRRVAIGRIPSGLEIERTFQVALPSEGRQFLVQFRVEGEGPAGRIGRGAVYNILPEGPSRPARVVSDASGRQIAEHAARRMEP